MAKSQNPPAGKAQKTRKPAARKITITPKTLERVMAMRPFDDIFMNRLFDGDKELTEFMLRTILEIELTVIKVRTQRDLFNSRL